MISDERKAAIIADAFNKHKFVEGQSEVAQIAMAGQFGLMVLEQALVEAEELIRKDERGKVADWLMSEIEGAYDYDHFDDLLSDLAQQLREKE